MIVDLELVYMTRSTSARSGSDTVRRPTLLLALAKLTSI
jgi:hypothetical protein